MSVSFLPIAHFVEKNMMTMNNLGINAKKAATAFTKLSGTMNKLEYLKTCKTYLRKVVNYRRNLNRMKCGKPVNAIMVKTIAEVEFYMPTFTFDSIHKWLTKVETRSNLIELIPVNKATWIDELDRLVQVGYRIRLEETKPQEASV